LSVPSIAYTAFFTTTIAGVLFWTKQVTSLDLLAVRVLFVRDLDLFLVFRPNVFGDNLI